MYSGDLKRMYPHISQSVKASYPDYGARDVAYLFARKMRALNCLHDGIGVAKNIPLAKVYGCVSRSAKD